MYYLLEENIDTNIKELPYYTETTFNNLKNIFIKDIILKSSVIHNIHITKNSKVAIENKKTLIKNNIKNTNKLGIHTDDEEYEWNEFTIILYYDIDSDIINNNLCFYKDNINYDYFNDNASLFGNFEEIGKFNIKNNSIITFTKRCHHCPSNYYSNSGDKKRYIIVISVGNH